MMTLLVFLSSSPRTVESSYSAVEVGLLRDFCCNALSFLLESFLHLKYPRPIGMQPIRKNMKTMSYELRKMHKSNNILKNGLKCPCFFPLDFKTMLTKH